MSDLHHPRPLDSDTEDFAQQIADSVSSFLLALREISRERRRGPRHLAAAARDQPDLADRRPARRPPRLRAPRRVPARRRARDRPRPDAAAAGHDARQPRHLQLRLRPLRARDGREPALRRPHQHRHRPRDRPAPLPRAATSRRRCGGGSSPTSPRGATWPAPPSTRCSRWWPTTASTPTCPTTTSPRSDEMLDGGPTPASVDSGQRARRSPASRQTAVVRAAAGSRSSRGHCRAEVRRIVRRRRRRAIKRVAQRIVETKRAGHDVVVAVSAMGDTHRRAARPRRARSARSRRRASSTCCSPPASGSRWRWSRWRSPTSASPPARSPAPRPA